jgi:hypothetical protein
MAGLAVCWAFGQAKPTLDAGGVGRLDQLLKRGFGPQGWDINGHAKLLR